MKLLKNNKGFGLAELVAVLPLGLLIVVAMTIGIIKFSVAYTEITLYSRLQREVIDTIESIKYGYPKDPYTKNQVLIGLSTAAKVSINGSKSITLKPPNLTGASGDSPYYSKFYLDRLGHLMVTSFYGNSVFTDQIFPDEKSNVHTKGKFKIINTDLFVNTTPNNGTDSQANPKLITVHIKARVRFRKRMHNQNTQDDLKKNTKVVDFKATIHAVNS